MVETAKSIVSNDTTKQLLKDQQDRFVSEVNSLVESLERVESHAKGLTQNNQELRRQLKLLEDDKETWRRRFLAVEHKEESMVRQMEAAIVARTEALQKTMSEQAGDAAEQIHSLMERIRALQGEVFQEQENVRKREQEVVAVQAEKSKVRPSRPQEREIATESETERTRFALENGAGTERRVWCSELWFWRGVSGGGADAGYGRRDGGPSSGGWVALPHRLLCNARYSHQFCVFQADSRHDLQAEEGQCPATRMVTASRRPLTSLKNDTRT
eukprot:912028-Rhodomonas_salina.7